MKAMNNNIWRMASDEGICATHICVTHTVLKFWWCLCMCAVHKCASSLEEKKRAFSKIYF